MRYDKNQTLSQLTSSIEAAKTTPCRWCGVIHGIHCPLVKAYEYFPDGTLKRVEFHAPQPVESGDALVPLVRIGQ